MMLRDGQFTPQNNAAGFSAISGHFGVKNRFPPNFSKIMRNQKKCPAIWDKSLRVWFLTRQESQKQSWNISLSTESTPPFLQLQTRTHMPPKPDLRQQIVSGASCNWSHPVVREKRKDVCNSKLPSLSYLVSRFQNFRGKCLIWCAKSQRWAANACF